MKMHVIPLTHGKNQRKAKAKLCWVEVTAAEALALIKSLVSQLQAGSPNHGRLESHCEGDASELSIAILDSLERMNHGQIHS